MPLKFILLIILAIIFAALILKNPQFVDINLYDFQFNPYKIRVPLLIVVLASLGFGFVLAWVRGLITKIKLKSIVRKNEKTILSLTDELEAYRKPTLPEHTKADN